MATILDTIAPISLTLGDYTFTMKNYRRIPGHDDSLPFTATLYINGKRSYEALNDGWGGEAFLTSVPTNKTDYNGINTYLRDNQFLWCEYEGHTLYYRTLPQIADALADNYDLRKELRKVWKHGKAVAYNAKTGQICSAPRALLAPYINKGYALVYNEDGSEVTA